ncbi:MAG TPA: cytochrome c maturation protein CcmE [Candidatus Polarisedimenticolia bacterium]|nr:cytochrome c maturation protein CcmE [Candidatus Polarisedimenticolia bacterium]
MAKPIPKKIIITVTFLVAGFAVLFGVGLRGSLVYYLTVGEYLDHRQAGDDLGDNYRINGRVLAGSIQRTPGVIGARFIVTDGTRQLRVVYSKETPDTFVDGSEVVVEGAMNADQVFVAHTLMAKCPSKYEAQNRESDYKRAPASGTPRTPAPSPGGAP